ncbi:MAG: glycosyltransferase [Frankiales bacterium]|nr:MAG: glycosyltransferase [Frankiales bacterium]
MILFVAAESPWPSHNGGRARMVGLIHALKQAGPVTVAVATGRRTSPAPADVHVLPRCGRSRLAALAGTGPFLGRGLLDQAGAEALVQLARAADAVVVSHSYLAAELPALAPPVFVDLPNLEVQRQRTTGTLLGRVESAKAARWEPRVVRAAQVSVCVDDADAETVRGWGAPAVVVVPNVAEVRPCPPSPPDGHVLAVADWTYGPNAAGGRALVRDVWPAVARRVPGARLVLAGRGGEELGGLGFVDDLDVLYRDAAVVVAPATSGGGTQLKVVDAVARGRVVVTTAYGARSLPAGATSACHVGDLVDGLVQSLVDVAARHRREELIRAVALPGWRVAAAPLIDALERSRA